MIIKKNNVGTVHMDITTYKRLLGPFGFFEVLFGPVPYQLENKKFEFKG
jgi:hypothetical protein